MGAWPGKESFMDKVVKDGKYGPVCWHDGEVMETKDRLGDYNVLWVCPKCGQKWHEELIH